MALLLKNSLLGSAKQKAAELVVLIRMYGDLGGGCLLVLYFYFALQTVINRGVGKV